MKRFSCVRQPDSSRSSSRCASGAPVTSTRSDLGNTRGIPARVVDLYVAALPERQDHVVVLLQERTIADKRDRNATTTAAPRVP